MKNTLYIGDCIKIMQTLEPESVDLILTSPPYNLTSRKGGWGDKTTRYDVYTDWMTESEYLDWMIEVFNNFNKVLSKKGVVLFNFSYSIENPGMPYKLVNEILTKTNFNIVDTIIWKKDNAMPHPANKYRLNRICEFIFVFVKKGQENDFNINKKVKSISEKTGQKYYEIVYNYFEAKNNDGVNELNKATFSMEMVEKLLNIYALPDSTVFDPFMGTGTTGIVCEQMNLNFIGSEISEKQVEYAQKRFIYCDVISNS